jgi:hypothetical protein
MYAIDLLVREVSVYRQTLENSVTQGKGWKKRGKERTVQKEAIFRQACHEVFNSFCIPEQDRPSLKKEIASIMGRSGSLVQKRNDEQRKKELADLQEAIEKDRWQMLLAGAREHEKHLTDKHLFNNLLYL